MKDSTILIPIEEYKELLKNTIRIEIFSKFVNSKEYSVSREECGSYLGFEVKNAGED